ncbi:type IV pilus biogenesis protein PilN [Myxococcus xanthus DK 1622]|uniref:PilN n=1 Tax=Myxococcus xanthus (strain DK1622) TaxID=246197 RepID=Q306N5_MYXXD|nr:MULTISPECIES: PilN domain-containing protein [Myxococcus]3JC8_Na Chain Na, PilN [Myxococcus xanthus DK 1622]3JC8_Nb Chain Nb, PilN [Myxococcus xanthus DK 1622]3JC8_Nc Chain Nc, PilN [Myxococcus xanthus DK 1622]3JC8_Nd Chain Nd, PilN [Myxococcus xanthus DK 1622]3JC8_Ne Chain Ne, PilN [Myxococcus xanthus DK 1622]3JC8_Nf Chain Nf, PilN [Myxococcus xanthus DK 1622]3JC8_Ng Chain Ng, PilN [Myxococcus xanthus DK 1622]3JC8_Nh Chain Nh, PilN [Myxococcus xanthus DK 1622]3JC8_Ni Chain Ni, PilN [My
MMIRINLLPVRAVKKREMGRQVLVLFAVVLIGAGVANYLWYDDRQSELEAHQAGVASTKARIAELEKIIGEVKNINTRKAEVEKKLAVLDALRKGRSGPVRMMDALASATPKKVWVKTFSENNNAVSIDGSAVSHDEVAEFMRGLNGVVWTPKGMGRLVDRRRDSKTARVEMLTSDATIEEFPEAQVSPFFKNIDLQTAKQVGGAQVGVPILVEFKITMTSNYAI